MSDNASQNTPQGTSNHGHNAWVEELARGLAAAVFPFLIREVSQLVKAWIGQGQPPTPPPPGDAGASP